MNLPLVLGILLLAVLAYLVWKEYSRKRMVRSIIDEKLFLPKGMRRGKAKKTPVTGTCYSCGKKVTMPYKCKFCGNLFCDKHRLPENHKCPGLKRLRREGRG